LNASTPTLTPFALENAQLLEAIATGEFKTKAALGAAQNRDPSNLSKTLKRLESEGYLDRSGLQLTAAGQAARLAIQRIDPAASPAAIADKADARGFAWIKVALIDSDPDLNPRKEFDDEKLAELTASVREKGVIQPILIRPARIAGKYLIVAGERRWRAAKLADLVEIPAMVRELSDEQALEIATIENVQRSDLTPLEEAVAFKKIIENRMRADPELALKDVKESIATAVNKTVRYVEQRVDLLELPPMLQKRLTLPDENPAHLNLKEARKEVQDQRARDREAKAKILAPDELLAMAEFYHAVANYPEKLEGWYYAQQLPVAVGFRAFEKGEVLDRLLNRQALYRIKGWKGDPRNFVREGYGYSKKEIDRQLPGFLGKDSDRVLRVQRIKVVGEAEAERIRPTRRVCELVAQRPVHARA
jgi:ParB/RepB/Spo0J family partition protein